MLQTRTEYEVAVGIVIIDKYTDFLTRLGQEFSERFDDFEEIEPCVMFTSNPFMEVDVRDISEQVSVLFDLDCKPLEMESIRDLKLISCFTLK